MSTYEPGRFFPRGLYTCGLCLRDLTSLVFCLLILSAYSQAQTTDSTQDNTELQIQTTDSGYSQSDDSESVVNESVESDSKNSPADNQQNKSLQTENNNAQDHNTEFNIDVLIERMKQTDAIGVISKLSLKNKVDDLLEQADEIKAKQAGSDLSKEKSALRENFEGLILKTVALLNKGEDFTLAEYIYLAREELWKSIMENKA